MKEPRTPGRTSATAPAPGAQRPGPGKRTLIEAMATHAPAAPGKQSITGDLRPAAGGQGLPAPLRVKLEPLFGMDLSTVRVHEGNEAQAMGAVAFARGEDLFFSPGAYRPGTPDGDELIAHELAHVAQQRAGRVAAPQGKGDPINADPSLEAEADAVAARVGRGEQAGLAAGGGTAAASGPVQRRVYKALSDSQQAQVDAVAENIFYTKAQTFETQVGAVATANPAGNTAATHMLQQLAIQHPLHAAVINAQLGQPASAKAAFIANVVNSAPGARVAASRTEQVAQTFDLPPNLEPTATHVVDPHGVAPPVAKNQVNQVNQATLDGGGEVKADSAYAAGARAQHLVVRGAGAVGASKLFTTAAATGANNLQTKVLALGWLLGNGTHSFHEVMLAAQDAGLAYNPGPHGAGYRDIAPLTQGDIGLHFPGFFFEPDFLILLARALFPDSANDRTDALATMPADVQAALAPIIARFRGVRGEAELAPLLGVGLARSLVEKLPDPAFTQLRAFVAFGSIAGLSWPQVQNHAVYQAVAATSGASEAELIFGHLFDRQTPGTHAQLLARAQNTMTDTPVASPGGNIGFALADHQQVDQLVVANRQNYGTHDRGVNLQHQVGPVGGLTANERSSINAYTDNNFGAWHALAGNGARTPINELAAMPGDGDRDEATQQMLAARGGLHALPVYHGPVYRGTGGAAANSQAAVDQLSQTFSPGALYAPHIFLSGAKTLSDSFVRAADIAYVFEDVKTGHDIQLLSLMPREREVLFEPSARFVVTRVENKLTPNNPTPANAGHAFTGGNFYVYLREISAQKSLAERNARDTAFNAAEERNTDGRRLVDNGMFREAYQAHMTEQRPLARPENRFEYHGALAALPANQALASTTFDDWKAADTFMRTCLNRPLTGPEIQQIHTHASQNLAGAHPGVLRGATDNVLAGGGIGPGGQWMAVDNAELAALQGNGSLTIDGIDAHPVPLAQQPAKTHTCRVTYVLGAALPAALTAWHGNYVAAFNYLLGQPAGPARNTAVVQFAASAQRDFISLHPFRDGNGRTSRLVMDHVLLSFGLPESIVADPNLDIMVGAGQWQNAVGTGVVERASWRQYYQGA